MKITRILCWIVFVTISVLVGGFIGWVLAIAAGSPPLKLILIIAIIAVLSFYGGMKHEKERRLRQFRLQKKKTLYKAPK